MDVWSGNGGKAVPVGLVYREENGRPIFCVPRQPKWPPLNLAQKQDEAVRDPMWRHKLGLAAQTWNEQNGKADPDDDDQQQEQYFAECDDDMEDPDDEVEQQEQYFAECDGKADPDDEDDQQKEQYFECDGMEHPDDKGDEQKEQYFAERDDIEHPADAGDEQQKQYFAKRDGMADHDDEEVEQQKRKGVILELLEAYCNKAMRKTTPPNSASDTPPSASDAPPSASDASCNNTPSASDAPPSSDLHPQPKWAPDRLGTTDPNANAKLSPRQQMIYLLAALRRRYGNDRICVTASGEVTLDGKIVSYK